MGEKAEVFQSNIYQMNSEADLVLNSVCRLLAIEMYKVDPPVSLKKNLKSSHRIKS